MSSLPVIFNKKSIPADQPCIKANDRGFTLGHGLFETVLINKGVVPLLDYHWERLLASAHLIHINIPFSRIELESMLTLLLLEHQLQELLAGARINLSYGESKRGIAPELAPEPNFLISVFELAIPVNNPFSALIVNTRKNEFSITSRVKSISYLDNILAKKEAHDQHYDEAILLNTASMVADGAVSNVFMVKDNQVITPPVSDGALPGVVRAVLLGEFGQEFSIIERSVSPAELLIADEIFLTNALMGVKSVSRLNNRDFYSFSVANRIRTELGEKKNYGFLDEDFSLAPS